VTSSAIQPGTSNLRTLMPCYPARPSHDRSAATIRPPPLHGRTGCGFSDRAPEAAASRYRRIGLFPGIFCAPKVGLPPRVRCAKPPLARPRNESKADIRRFERAIAPRPRGSLARPVGCAVGAGAAGRVNCEAWIIHERALLQDIFLWWCSSALRGDRLALRDPPPSSVAYKQPDPRSCRPMSAASMRSTMRAMKFDIRFYLVAPYASWKASVPGRWRPVRR